MDFTVSSIVANSVIQSRIHWDSAIVPCGENTYISNNFGGILSRKLIKNHDGQTKFIYDRRGSCIPYVIYKPFSFKFRAFWGKNVTFDAILFDTKVI